ncbi:short-chain alcohol-related dehydrogenase [Gaiella occulta]|uniref:Short-chain alcohol-related dehydrogenase n=1 Tax=Gaiella occulta TaxID=1002870 RepID=A0A7M2YX79_9ACTN|nr:SDR family oxidoreductase [Gaiella occulta]RDI74605.1 short-chain alcohol-related dehydrogenase [Gaiella occulta]
MSARLTGRVTVVTGGASGLGRAIAVRFADEGAHVVVGDVRRDPVEGGAEIAEILGERGHFVETDASRWDDVDRLVTSAVDRYGRLDVMVCNAGVAGRWSKGLLETTEEDWDAIMAVNLRGTFLGTKRAVGEMLVQEPIGEVRGRVVIISSQHGMVGPPGHVAYAASKGGVVNFVHQVAVDFGRLGVLVNAVAPGKILTGNPAGMRSELLEYSHARTPFHRLGRPEDVAGAALFLASDDAGYVSGINLLVDGGWMAY